MRCPGSREKDSRTRRRLAAVGIAATIYLDGVKGFTELLREAQTQAQGKGKILLQRGICAHLGSHAVASSHMGWRARTAARDSDDDDRCLVLCSSPGRCRTHRAETGARSPSMIVVRSRAMRSAGGGCESWNTD